ncbi:MAG: hypothetical protein KDC05_16075 [Bacteroidales bacterium]|nr:hypothetical protein [Bacteroidales bacterium]
MNGKVINNLRRNFKPKSRKLPSTVKATVFLTLVALIMPVFAISQESDSVYYADSKSSTLKYLKCTALLEKEKRESKDFINTNKIDLAEYQEAIVLIKTRIKNDPDTETGRDVANVDIGSVVKIYKFCRKNKSWAVKYKNKWGFLPESALQVL